MLGLYYIPALCYNAATKFQCINSLSYTHNNEFILNALLGCVILAYTHCILSYLKCFIHLNFLLTVCLLLLQELELLQYIYYIPSHALSTPKTNF